MAENEKALKCLLPVSEGGCALSRCSDGSSARSRARVRRLFTAGAGATPTTSTRLCTVSMLATEPQVRLL